ncbi:hypothetical protein FNV43_RR17934 [Rhamnella rubrinervis]|uniref:RING-type E3 ubiquitin transferase n=1 Tax=Rhamnella rubrinervis TaxID=2594499 RepID=A0A8K0DZS5_9ROSA|nr:hypothetical protein FNV43_RR17934 [Rhamnella rubrinervis]
MADSIPSSFAPPPPAVPTRSNLPMLYYGLVVVGTAAVVLALYNIIVIKWCAQRQRQSSSEGPNPFIEISTRRSRSFENLELLSSFKYKKQGQEQGDNGYECAVCLSVFEDGEEVRKLPGCKHSFHAPCIDMWLYSHSDCPLCRTPVPVGPPFSRHLTNTPEENSREVLLGPTVSV